MDDKEKEKEVEYEEPETVMSDEVRLGDYTNYVRIQHSGIDFRFDFAKIISEENAVCVISRLFMSPMHAKLFYKALEENIQKYENSYGPINIGAAKGIPLPGTPSKEKH